MPAKMTHILRSQCETWLLQNNDLVHEFVNSREKKFYRLFSRLSNLLVELQSLPVAVMVSRLELAVAHNVTAAHLLRSLQQQGDAPSVVWDAGAESRREGQQCRGDAGSRVTASWCPPVGTPACPLQL